MVKEEYKQMFDKAFSMTRDIFHRVETKLATGAVSLEDMGVYTDIMKDSTKALKNLHSICEEHHESLETL